MSILSKLIDEVEVDGSEDLKDFGGAGFIGQSGVYDLKITRAYLKEAKSGAGGIVIEFGGEGMMEQTLWVMTKEGKSKDKNGKTLQSYAMAKKINYLITNELVKLQEFKTETKLIKIKEWSETKDENGKRKKVDKEIEADVLVDWIDKDIKVGVWMEESEKQELKDGKYTGTGMVSSDKDGNAYLSTTIFNLYNTDGKTASELNGDKEPTKIVKDKEFLAKTPVKKWKPKGSPKGGSTTPSKPIRPDVF